MAGEKIERIITINLSKAYKKPTTKRGNYAIKLLRIIIARNMKAQNEMIVISNSVNNYILAGKYTKPRRLLKVKAISEEGKINVLLPDEKIEIKGKEEKEKKSEAKKIEEKKPEKEAEKTEKTEMHIGGERKAPGAEEKTAEKITEEKERHDLNKLKKG